MAPSRPALVRLSGLLLAVTLGSALAVIVLGGDLERVRRAVDASGAWGPLVYIGLHIVVTLVPVPKNLLAGIAGALFGLTAGIVLSWVAAMVSAWVTFLLARRLGHDAVASITGPRIDRARQVLRDQGLLAVVVARLTPVVPFTVINYGAGVSPIARREFVAGTAMGIIPGTVAYAAVGASAGEHTSAIGLAGGALVLLLVAAGLVARRLRRP